MQPLEQIEHDCYQGELARAERYMNSQEEEPERHGCWACSLAADTNTPCKLACLRAIAIREKRGRFAGYTGDVYLIPITSCAEDEDCDMWEPLP